MNTIIKIFSFLAMMFSASAHATYVGEVQTTKFLDPQTVNMISTRLQAGQPGIQVGDEISYFIQFTPTNNGGMVGAGGYVTDYIPAGTQVTNAQFVQVNSNGTFTQIAPPTPAAVLRMYVPIYTETGIFYSTDPRTAKYTSPSSPNLTSANGYPLGGATGCNGISLPSTTHNDWDQQMMLAYETSVMGQAGVAPNAGCATLTMPTLLVGNPNASIVGGAVTGPDSLIQNDYSLSTGPWHRISYPGSMMGTLVGTPLPSNANACVGGTPTSAGASFPLPANTNAVRFAAGRVTVGQLFTVRITLKVTSPVGISGIINNSEVFGGDASLDPGSVSGRHVPWRYHCPAVANADTTMTVIKRVVGMCVGAACVPQAFTSGAIPSLANVKLRYEILYMNSSGGPQTGVVLSDVLPAGGALVAGSEVIKAGPNILPTVANVGGFQFQNIPSLGSGGGGTVQFDVLFAAAVAANAAVSNTALLTSVAIPAGVQSVATVTATTLANLTANKTTSTSSVAPLGTATYTISVTNNGAAAATTVTVADYLPSNGFGTTTADRFSFKPQTGLTCGVTVLTAAQACGSMVTAGVATPVVLGVTYGAAATVAPYIGQNREVVTFTYPATPAFASGSTLNITFDSIVGANIASSATPYTNDVDVHYMGGFATAPAYSSATVGGVAPVTVSSPLGLVMSIDCVYSGVTCVAGSYTGGTIPSGSKVKYRLAYSNGATSPSQTGLSLTNTLPTGVTFVAGSATGITPTQVGQVLTFNVGTLTAGATGAVTFDALLGATILSGTYITNNAKMVSTQAPGGVTDSQTTSVLDTANLVITKTTTTPTITVGGIATYKITVTNTGNMPASTIMVYDELPFTAVAGANFNYLAAVSTVGMTAVVPTFGPPTLSSYLANVNQTEVLWNFGAQTLAAGASFTITYTAQAAATIAASSSTVYSSDAIAQFNSGLNVLYASNLGTAPVTIPSNLTIATTIDCVYTGTVCNTYNGSGIIPVNAKVRYKMHYKNTAATAQTNVYLCNQLSSDQVTALTATITTPVTTAAVPATIPATPFANTAPMPAGAVTIPAVAACGYPVPVAPTTVVDFSYPVIPSLGAGVSGDVFFDAAMNAAAAATITSSGMIALSAAPAGPASASETNNASAFVQNVPVLSITKTTSTPGRKPGQPATYTITIKNTGNVATTSLKVYDFLPFSGTAPDATKQFLWSSNGAISCAPAAPCTTLPAPTVSVPGFLPFSNNPNQQQVLWNFGAFALAAGSSVSFTFTASTGANLPAGNYDNNVQADFTYLNGATTLSGSYNSSFTDTTDRVVVANGLADMVVTIGNGVNAVAANVANNIYTIVVTNNGPDSASGTLVQMPATAGLSKTAVSCTSANLSCPIVSTIAALEGAGLALNPLNMGQSATITVTTTVTALSGSVTATATAVLPNGIMDSTPLTPLTVSDTDPVVVPDLSTSSLSFVDSNGGSHDPGNTMTYTVTLIESAGVAANSVTVTAPIPLNTGSLTVVGTLPTGASLCPTNSPTNYAICGISVPANGTVTLQFSVVINPGPAPAAPAVGTVISSTATITVPSGTGGAPTASFTVGTPPTTGMKDLYMYGADAATGLVACAAATPCKLSRATPPATVPSNSTVTITRGAVFTWNLGPALQAPVTLDPLISATVPVTLNLSTTNPRNYNVLVELYCSNAVPVAPAAISQTLAVPLTATVTPTAFALPLAAATTCPATFSWVLRVTNSGGVNATRTVIITPSVAAVAPATTPTYSKVSLPSKNVVNVDSVNAYNAAYPAVTTAPSYGGGQTVYLRAVVSDPFGSADISAAKVAVATQAGVLTNLLTGTVTVTAASPTVTGVGTLFTTQLVVGDVIAIGGSYYTVSAIASATSLTLASNVATAGTGLSVNKPVAMTMVADSLALTKTFELAYAIPAGAAAGVWNAEVVGVEGTEGTVKHARSGGFTVKPGVDHYEISVPNGSIACMPTTVTVKACADTSNPCATPATTINSSVTLAVVSPATGVTLTPATFNLVSGVGTANITYPTAVNGTNVVMGLNAVTDAGVNPVVCAGGASGCTTTFNTAGFIVSDTNAGTAVTIPTQVAGVGSATYFLRAVQTNTATKMCQSILTGPQSVGVGYECVDPATCPAFDLMSVSGSVPPVGRNDTVGVTPVSMNFDPAQNDAAAFTFNYSDVGTVKLHFHKTGVGGATLDGVTTTILVNPHHFAVDVCNAATVGDCPFNTAATPTDGTGAILAKAGTVSTQTGTAFKATVRAMNGAATSTVTPSYGTAGSVGTATNTTENVLLSHALVAPAGGATGALNGTKTFARSTFTAGVKTVSDLTWSEVGVITLKADASAFMGAALATTGTSANAGRFTPDHFDTTATGPMTCAIGLTCPAGGMAYSGQAFTNAVVTARNAAGATTVNYTSGFAKTVTMSPVSASGGTALTVGALAPTAVTGFASGTATVTGAAAPIFTFTTPPVAPTDVYVRATDNDMTPVVSGGAGSTEGGVKVVSGRVKISNAVGSELVPLTVSVVMQYFDGTNWVQNKSDTTTGVTTSNVTIGNLQLKPATSTLTIAKVTPAVTPVTLTQGAGSFKLPAPGANATGSVDLTASILNALGVPYLQTSAGAGRATFGVYQGRKEFIYLRENY